MCACVCPCVCPCVCVCVSVSVRVTGGRLEVAEQGPPVLAQEVLDHRPTYQGGGRECVGMHVCMCVCGLPIRDLAILSFK